MSSPSDSDASSAASESDDDSLSPADLAPDLADALHVLYAPDYHFFGKLFQGRTDCVICSN